jgi:hypothetical protein
MSDLPSGTSEAGGEISVTLDGLPVRLPSGYCSLNAIRCHLEALALEKQRVLASLSVDGELANLSLPTDNQWAFCRIEAETIALEETPLLLLRTALEQTGHVRKCVETALTLVLINDIRVAREIWWNLAWQLKEPVLTLSLLPDDACGPADGCAPLAQLRKWQLEQIAAIIKQVDETCYSEDTIPLSNALEHRVLPWLQKLSELIGLWHETVMAGLRLSTSRAAA